MKELPLPSCLELRLLRAGAHDNINDVRVHQLDVRGGLGGVLRDVLPECHCNLGGNRLEVPSEVLKRRAIREGVRSHPLNHFRVERTDFGHGDRSDTLLILVVLEEYLFHGDVSFTRCEVRAECNRRGHSNKAGSELLNGVSCSLILHVVFTELVLDVRLREVVPGSTIGVLLHVFRGGCGIQHRAMQVKEVQDIRVDVTRVRIRRGSRRCPLVPLVPRGGELANPPAGQECRVEVGDLILRAVVVDSHEDSRFGVKDVSIELVIEANLECCLDDFSRSTVAFVEEEESRFVAALHEPVHGSELRANLVTFADFERQSNHVTFTHLRKTSVNDFVVVPTFALCDASCDEPDELRLSNAMTSHDHDRLVRRKHLNAFDESFDIHVFSFGAIASL